MTTSPNNLQPTCKHVQQTCCTCLFIWYVFSRALSNFTVRRFDTHTRLAALQKHWMLSESTETGIAQSVQWLCYGREHQEIVNYPFRSKTFCVLQNVQTRSGDHPTVYPLPLVSLSLFRFEAAGVVNPTANFHLMSKITIYFPFPLRLYEMAQS